MIGTTYDDIKELELLKQSTVSVPDRECLFRRIAELRAIARADFNAQELRHAAHGHPGAVRHLQRRRRSDMRKFFLHHGGPGAAVAHLRAFMRSKFGECDDAARIRWDAGVSVVLPAADDAPVIPFTLEELVAAAAGLTSAIKPRVLALLTRSLCRNCSSQMLLTRSCSCSMTFSAVCSRTRLIGDCTLLCSSPRSDVLRNGCGDQLLHLAAAEGRSRLLLRQ